MLLLSSKFVSMVTQLAKSAYTIFTSALLSEQRWIVEHQRNEKHKSETVPPLGTPLHLLFTVSAAEGLDGCCWSQFWKGVGGAEEEKTLCGGLRAKHFNFFVWNYRLGFYFDEIKDFLCYLLAFKQIANLESASVQYSFTPSVAVPAALQVVFNPLGLSGTLQ